MASGATFEAFFEAEHRQLFRSLVLITGDRQEADDVAQEAMVRILGDHGRNGTRSMKPSRSCHERRVTISGSSWAPRAPIR